jgi:hypothetical protein
MKIVKLNILLKTKMRMNICEDRHEGNNHCALQGDHSRDPVRLA